MNEKKQNVLMTTSSFFRDKEEDIFGGGNFVFQLAKGLNKENKVFILAPKSKISKKIDVISNVTIYRFKQFFFDYLDLAFGPGIIPNIKKNKFLVFTIPYFALSQLINIINIVKKSQIHILHSHWLLPQGVIAAIYKILFNPKIQLISTIHGSDLFNMDNKLINQFKIFAINKADKVTVVSNALKDKLNELVPNKEVHVMPMGIDISLFNINEKNKSILKSYNDDIKYIIFIGALIKEKGIIELIEAMKIVIESNKSIKLLIIGDGNLKEDLIHYSIENKLVDYIEFLGFISNELIPDYLSIASFLVLPSYSEGFGLVVAEAMACGVKPIVSNLPAFKDFVDSETGIFLDEITPNEIATKILENINLNYTILDKDKLRKCITDKYSWKNVIYNYNNIYNTNGN